MKGQDDSAGSPYRDLYIYAIQGHVTEAEGVRFGDGFLGNWVEEDASYLFFSCPSREVVSKAMAHRQDLEVIDEYHFSYENWQGASPGPMRVQRFLISPPWELGEPKSHEIHMVLDPGVVFGNGLHPTTRDCLKALTLLEESRPPRDVLDLGTGTGILAIAAALLGAEDVLAVDINPLCVKTAARNVKLNHLEDTIHVEQGRAEDVSLMNKDVLIANIHYDVLRHLVQKGAVHGFRRMIFSGLMRSQYRSMKIELEKNGIEVMGEWDQDMTWYTMFAVRN